MPLPVLAQLGIAAAPSIIKGTINLLGGAKGRKSDYEKETLRMADIFKSEANSPLTQNREYLAGKSALDSRDRKLRSAINSGAAVTGATDEARLANISSSNDSYNDAVNQLLSIASSFRDSSRSRYIDLLGMTENARQNRLRTNQGKINSIIDPLSTATSALVMSDLFPSKKMLSEKGGPAALNTLDSGLSAISPHNGPYA